MRGKIPFDPHIIIFLYTEEIMFKKGVVPSQGLRIIIVGCGKVGRTLVEQLGKEGHDITIVDKNRERISQVSNIYDVMGIVGNGASYKIDVYKRQNLHYPIYLITEKLNPDCCIIGICRKYIKHITMHSEGASVKIHIIPGVL